MKIEREQERAYLFRLTLTSRKMYPGKRGRLAMSIPKYLVILKVYKSPKHIRDDRVDSYII